MNIDKFGFDMLPGTESYDDEVYEEGTEGIRKLWNRHVRGAQKLNKYESAEYYGKLEKYADQLRTYVINELGNKIKEGNKNLGIKAKITPFKANKGGVSGFDEFSSKDNQKSFYILGICTYDANVKNTKDVNKQITACIKKFMKEHKPPVDLYHEIRGNEQHVLVPERGIIAGVQESEEFDWDPSLEVGNEGLKSTLADSFKAIVGLVDNIAQGFGEVAKSGYKLINNAFWDLLLWARDLTAEDYEFMKSGQMKKVGDELAKEYKKGNYIFEMLPANKKNIPPETFNVLNYDFGNYTYNDYLRLFNTEDDFRGMIYPIGILKCPTNMKTLKESFSKEQIQKSNELFNRLQKIVEERSPKGFQLYAVSVNATDVVLIYASPRYKNKNKVINSSI